ncbi:hypothetical protein EK21DRAFT_93762 [Setomelanomma holmii]|uniref:Uncharacterized protein n=1 Tax=Setomelanomma holmii TaxID=210430 RepID=A0A9P4GZI6_9PLEO|nr:hypothetical protein EK21DRAFT_93762 [Setomelanomma holmii]
MCGLLTLRTGTALNLQCRAAFTDAHPWDVETGMQKLMDNVRDAITEFIRPSGSGRANAIPLSEMSEDERQRIRDDIRRRNHQVQLPNLSDDTLDRLIARKFSNRTYDMRRRRRT